MKSIIIVDSYNDLVNDDVFKLIKKNKYSDFLFIKKNKYILIFISQLSNVSIIDISPEYYNLLNLSCKNINCFFANFPQKKIKLSSTNLKSFHSHFFNKDCSPWWLMDFSNKAPDGEGCINRFFQLDIISYYLKKKQYDLGIVISDEAGFEKCVKDLFAKHKISCCRKTQTVSPKLASPVSIYLKRLLILVKFMTIKFFVTFFMLFFKSGKNASSNSYNNKICFHSWFPAHWININDISCDKYFVNLVDYINKNSKIYKPFYLFKLTFYDKTFKDTFKSFIKIFKIEFDFDFMERYMSIWELFKLLLDPIEIFKFIRCEKNNSYIKNFEYNGINVFELVQTELRMSYFYNFPYHAAVATATHNFFKYNNNFKLYVTFLELYAYSRGIYKKLTAFEKLKTIAFQHSTITKYNLQYSYDPSEIDMQYSDKLPLPDYFILSGYVPQNTLKNSGLPDYTLKVTGSPRYDFINEFIAEKNQIKRTKEQKIVLIATVSEREESLKLLKLSLKALKEKSNIKIIIKTHPMCNIKKEIVDYITKNYNEISYEINDDYIYKSIIKANLMITSNSMVGLESLILGTNVVLYADPFKINISPLAKSPEFKEKICYSDEQFIKEIKKNIINNETKPNDTLIKKLISDFYYKLDGRANERILNFFEDIIDEKN